MQVSPPPSSLLLLTRRSIFLQVQPTCIVLLSKEYRHTGGSRCPHLTAEVLCRAVASYIGAKVPRRQDMDAALLSPDFESVGKLDSICCGTRLQYILYTVIWLWVSEGRRALERKAAHVGCSTRVPSGTTAYRNSKFRDKGLWCLS